MTTMRRCSMRRRAPCSKLLRRGNPDKHDAEVIEHLRKAARKPAFVPVVTDAAETDLRARVEKSSHGFLVGQLTSAAAERLRYREPEAAAALVLDALRLIRLIDSAPGWWSWHMH